MNNMELYQEEQRQILLDLNKGIAGLSQLIQTQIDKYEAPHKSVEVTGSVKVNTQDSVDVKNLSEVKDSVIDLGRTLETAIKENAYAPLEAVTVTNIKDVVVPDTIKINNLTELKGYFITLAKAIADNQPIVNVAKQDIVFPTDPKKPIAVRLSDGRKFYAAMTAAFSGGVATAGLATDAKLDQVIQAVQGISVTSTPDKDTDRYGIQAISQDATYKYFWFEADDADYYIMRKHKTTSVFSFTKGTGGYAAVYVDEVSGPSGTPTWASRGVTF